MNDSSLAQRKYNIRSALFLSGYVAVNVAAIFGAFDDLKPRAAALFALVVAAPIIGHIWALLVLMRDSDEFMRGLMARRFIVASGVVMAVSCTWGFLETYARAPHAPAFLVVPLFWLAFGAVSPFIRTTH